MMGLELGLQEPSAPGELVMKCLECGSSMTTHRENVPHEPPGTVLLDAPVKRCAECGAHGVGIESYDELDRLILQEVLRKPERLNGGEIRYLRSSLDVSSGELAKLIGSDPSTISRWEADKQTIGHQADLLLRALVILYADGEGYPIAQFAELGGEKSGPSRYVFKRIGSKWQSVPAAAHAQVELSPAWKTAGKGKRRKQGASS